MSADRVEIRVGDALERRRIDQDWMGADERRGAKAQQEASAGPLFDAAAPGQ